MTFEDLRVEPGRQEIWIIAPAPCGPGCILVAHQTGQPTAWVIAPPAVRLLRGEPGKPWWRVARYEAADPEELLFEMTSHVPRKEQDLTVGDVCAMVPIELEVWVSRVHDRHLALADGFGHQEPRPIEFGSQRLIGLRRCA
jgi:hypothetical protein